MTDFLEKIRDKKTGIQYYVVPKGQKLFRGDNSSFLPNEGEPFVFPTIPVFFGYTMEDVVQYGIVFEFRTKREYRLVALDDRETMEKIYHLSNGQIKNILRQNYGYVTGIRDSDNDKDKFLSEYLCSQGYEGYSTNTMKTDMGGKFHKEIVICNPQDIEVVSQLTPEKERKRLLEESKLRNIGKTMKENRKKRPKEEEYDITQEIPSSIPSSNIFSSFESPKKSLFFSTPPTTPPRGGGSKRKSRKQKKNCRRKTCKK